MAIFGNLRPQAAISSTQEAMIREIYGGGYATSSGISVSSETAMRLLTVHNCVKVLYNCISQMPCQLMEEVGGIKNKAKGHYLYRKISKRPNQWMTAPEFWGMAIAHISLRGNFYAFKTRNSIGQIIELLPIAPGRVREVIQNPNYSLTYKIASPDGSIIKEYPQSAILHIRGMVDNGFMGINPIERAAREAVGLGLANEKFLSRFFGNGAHPGTIIKHPLSLNAPAHAELKKSLKLKMDGLGKSWDTVLLDEGMDVTFPPVKLVDAQFLELGKFNEAQIAGMFGVPLMLIQAGDNPTTYASATEFKRTFVDLVLAPIAVNFESSIDRDCLTDEEQDRYYTKFNLNSLLRGNIVERFGAYAVGINSEILNPNECRQLEDMNSYEGGDEYRTRTSSMKETNNTADNQAAGGKQ